MIGRLSDRQPQFEGKRHFIAANATIIGSVIIKAGASIWFNAVVRADNDVIEIGSNSNIQDGAILHTDAGIRLVIGNNVTIGHRATLHGCTIGDNSLIGIGSSVLNNAKIGANSLLAAHSLVTEGKQYPDGVLLLGSPARVVRNLHTDELEMIRQATDSYVRNSIKYLDELSALAAQ